MTGFDAPARVSDDERRRRWRLALGAGDDTSGGGVGLSDDDLGIDGVLAALYDSPPRKGAGGKRRGGLGRSAPSVARWLGDVRRYFPSSVVQVMQRDAIDRLDLQRLLLEPEMLAAVEPDVHLVGTLLALRHLLPDSTTATARQVVAKVVTDLEARLARPLHDAVSGALRRESRSRRPRHGDIDWNRTIHANLRHWSPELRTIVPERLVGYGRRLPTLGKDVVLAIDQSGSMADSVVYAAVLGASLATLRTVRTSLVAFDTAVVDLTDLLADPVDVLFGVQLGGGTDINHAVAYCSQLVKRSNDTVFVLVSDLFEGGDRDELIARIGALARAGVTCVVLLALSDDG
ncbi:MAG TPA: VWA domain-containing protein, partial [Acidimicrobiales bacterium]